MDAAAEPILDEVGNDDEIVKLKEQNDKVDEKAVSGFTDETKSYSKVSNELWRAVCFHEYPLGWFIF